MEAIAEKLYTVEEYFAFCEQNDSDLKEAIDLLALNIKLLLSVIYKKINLISASSPSE